MMHVRYSARACVRAFMENACVRVFMENACVDTDKQLTTSFLKDYTYIRPLNLRELNNRFQIIYT